MKINWNKKYTTIMLYAMAVILALVLTAFLISDLPAAWQAVKNFISNLSPIFYGAIFAYLLAPFVNFLERRVLCCIKKPKMKRAFSIVITFIVLLAVIALLAWRIAPKVIRGYMELQVMASWYLEAVSMASRSFRCGGCAFGLFHHRHGVCCGASHEYLSRDR